MSPYYGSQRDYPPPRDPTGQCDWGYCDTEATTWRWDDLGQRYLPVCDQHRHDLRVVDQQPSV